MTATAMPLTCVRFMILPTSASIAAPFGIVCATTINAGQKRAQSIATGRRSLSNEFMLKPHSMSPRRQTLSKTIRSRTVGNPDSFESQDGIMGLVMQHRALSILLAIAALPAAEAATPALQQQFERSVRPFVAKYCVGCHSGQMPAGQFDLKAYATVGMVTADYPRWALVMERLTAKEMPPKPLSPPPSEATREVIAWIQAVRAEEIRKSAGDPGIVLARRLSNAEYNYTIRDLTGQDMRITREFPVDPANPAGFDNSGESLSMSPALLSKYLQAAREVADHLVLLPDGIDFGPYPMLVETDREKYAIRRILNFYALQPTNYADYFEAAWRYKYRVALKKPHATLATTAVDAKVSPKYLPMVWE